MSDIPPLDAQLAALDEFCEYLPADMRALVRERFLMGYDQYGDAWADRDNLAEAAPEIADAVVYTFQATLTGQLRTLYPTLILWPLQVAWRYIQRSRGVPE